MGKFRSVLCCRHGGSSYTVFVCQLTVCTASSVGILATEGLSARTKPSHREYLYNGGEIQEARLVEKVNEEGSAEADNGGVELAARPVSAGVSKEPGERVRSGSGVSVSFGKGKT